jgi:hypothetical protein
MQLGGYKCRVSWDSGEKTLTIYTPGEARYVEELRVLDGERRPLGARGVANSPMGSPELVLKLKELPEKVILVGRVWRDIKKERVPVRLEWANRWSSKENLKFETASARAGSDLRVDVRSWTVMPGMPYASKDRRTLEVQLRMRSVKGPARVDRVWWATAKDDRGTDLLSGPIEGIGGYGTEGSVDGTQIESGKSSLITLTTIRNAPRPGAGTVRLEAWVDMGVWGVSRDVGDPPRWVPFHVDVPMGVEKR